MEKMPGSFSTRHAFSQGVRIDQSGRVVVPAPIRRALGITPGQMLHISLVEGFVRLQTVEAGLERIWAIARSR
jgi:AbrB family looped-hinge helix DNA binding protein